MIGPEECNRVGSAGRVSENVEVKVMDHVTGEPLAVGQKGELLVRGPAVMTGNQTRMPAALHIYELESRFLQCL
jgi:long-subunit acyl-CoA synthetase (AMP-forming)